MWIYSLIHENNTLKCDVDKQLIDFLTESIKVALLIISGIIFALLIRLFCYFKVHYVNSRSLFHF